MAGREAHPSIPFGPPASVFALLVLSSGALLSAQVAHDPLAEAIALWQDRMGSAPLANDEAKEIRSSSAPVLAHAEKALAQGKRWFALSQLARVWTDLEATDYCSAIDSESRHQMAELEREWRRLGPELSIHGGADARQVFDPLPAAARALGEAALAQVPVLYDASLDYGRNTAPQYGLYYLGAAQAQRDFARIVARLERRPAGLPPLSPRDASGEIAAVRDELLSAYVPPLSIDRHATFIAISALLKEADELEAAGARYGALYRLLDARAQLSRLTHPGRTLSTEEAERRGREVEATLRGIPGDTSLQRLFLDTALSAAAESGSASHGGELAAAIFDDVLPYFPAVLGPAPPRPPERQAEATVTLVRWPYT